MVVLISQASLAQQKALAFVPKCSSLLSLLGSLYICYDVMRMPPSSRKTYHRLMLGMSLCDCMASSAWFFTTWPIPYDVFPAYGASGTQATCTAQGYFAQLSISTVLYNGCLAAYYFLVVFWGWSDSRLRGSRVEYVFHGLAIAFGVGTSTTATAMGLFNPIGWDCWLSAVPMGCQESWLNNGETTCIRGDNANLWQWIFFYIPLWITIAFVGSVMGMIVHKFIRQKRAVSRWDITTSSNQEEDRSKGLSSFLFGCKTKQGNKPSRIEKQTNDTVNQALHYVGCFLIAWTFPTILRIHELLVDEVYYHFVFLSAMFVPTQGLFNFCVYMRPRYQKICAERQLKRQRSSNFRQQVIGKAGPKQDPIKDVTALTTAEDAHCSTTSAWSLAYSSEDFKVGGPFAATPERNCSHDDDDHDIIEDTFSVDATSHTQHHGSSEQRREQLTSNQQPKKISLRRESIRNFVKDLAQAMKEGDAGLGGSPNTMDDTAESADEEAISDIPYGDIALAYGKNRDLEEIDISAPETFAEEQGEQLPTVRDIHEDKDKFTHAPDPLQPSDNECKDESDEPKVKSQSQTSSDNNTATQKKKKKKKRQDPLDSPQDEALVASLQAILIDMANENADFDTA